MIFELGRAPSGESLEFKWIQAPFHGGNLLAAAGVSAVGLAIKDASGEETARPEDVPRLPVSILVRGELQDAYLQQIQKLSPQIAIGKDVAVI